MAWPQITVIVLLAASFGICAAKNGEPRPPYNVVSATLSIALWLVLLHYGGFFN